MTPLRQAVWGCALVLTAATAGPASAAWNNVFQVTCFNCRGSSSGYYSPGYASAYYAPAYSSAYSSGYAPASDGCNSCAPACAPACPQQTCTTRYVQRCYYQPVTTYRTSSYLEPVTTYRTSYYYEPVTSYRYSCYYDPCTCSYQQVAQPCTSYQLRQRCCPVTSYLQRTCQVPVTVQQQMFYYEPVTTCCTTSVGAAVATPPATAPAVAAPPSVIEQRSPPAAAPPSVLEQRSPPAATNPPSVQDSRDAPPADGMKYPRNSAYPNMQRAPEGSSYRQPTVPPASRPTQTRPAAVRLDRIVVLPGHNLEGRVVTASRQPQAGAGLLFVSAERTGSRQAVTADNAGQFRVSLDAGAWLVYTRDANGQPVFSQKVDVTDGEARQVTLLGR